MVIACFITPLQFRQLGSKEAAYCMGTAPRLYCFVFLQAVGKMLYGLFSGIQADGEIPYNSNLHMVGDKLL